MWPAASTAETAPFAQRFQKLKADIHRQLVEMIDISAISTWKPERLRREVREESGLECEELTLCGTISWPGFGKQGEDWFGFVFRVDRWSGSPRTENPEGDLVWVDVDRVLELPLWEGDHHFLPLVFDADPRPFHGVMPYRGGRMLSWTYSRI